MPKRDARLEANQRVFRTANERLEERVRKYDADEPIPFLCECGDDTCLGRIELTRAEYHAVRAEPNRFAILPGHRMTERERVVDDRGKFHIVEKEAE